MPDYGKLIDEEKQKQDSAIAAADAQRVRDIEMVAFFREVEIELGVEMAKANVELKKRAAPSLFGPLRPIPGQERFELAFGLRSPCCRITLHNTEPLAGVSAIRVELIEPTGNIKARTRYVIEGEPGDIRACRSPIEGFPDRSSQITPSEIAQEIVCGILRGRFE